MLTASPDFFKYASEDDKYKWVEVNLEFLNKEYGDNCIYATCHFDETASPHIHGLITAKFPHEFKTNDKKFILNSNKYFGGKELLKDLQDKYGKFMNEQFPILKRGIEGSTAKHTEIKRFYGMVRAEKQAENEEETHRYNLYLRTNLKQTEGILNAYKE
ncbi:plasmid recombination protein, partial [Arthrospira platensis SPKY1]|nr:plasmid recombination protein [Arthrospira platensis SPKY1]